MMWTTESGRRLKSMASRQTTLSDGTYERFEKIEVSVKHGTEKTLACIATGDSVNGTSTRKITLLPLSGERDIVGLIFGLVIGIPAAVTILVLLVANFWHKYDQNFVPQRVSEEFTSTVQTTLNSEDETRKWYSIKWADFKLCCRRLRDVSTQHPRIPFWFYAFYRTALATYFFVFFITYVVLGVRVLGAKFFIYLPVWAYTASVCYVCIAFFNVAMDFVKNRENAAFEDKVRYQIQWCLFNIAAASCPLVTGGVWIGVYYAVSVANLPMFIIVYISVDLLPTVVCLFEIFLTQIVVRFVHAIYPGFYLIIYLLFTVIYWAVGGTDPGGRPYISPILDYEYYPGIATASVIGATLAVLLALAVSKGLYTLRVRCMDRTRTEAIPATEESSTVALESLTTYF
ncbi:protein rolling stone-like [Diadema setosum]|uniref:protein rolling stone-like n=1 Tax=Diadema setosum TaxID=31175 RepID=UPI003B3A1062